ncbi:MAG: hypothetical protein ACJ0K4_15130 [Verrucomicrobiales bacterium]
MKELIISLITFSLFTPCAFAEKEKGGKGNNNIGSLIKQLDDDQFSKREAAVKKLTELGAAAIPALTKATRRKSPESSMRAFNIIVRQYKDGDGATKNKATNALKKIAKSDKPHAAEAKKLLEPPKSVPRTANGVTAKADIKIGGHAGINRRVSVMVQNGVTTVDAEENGQKVKILEDPKKGITVEITEGKEGKKETNKYQAANAEELKKKNPKAHELYQKYTGNVKADGGNVNIKIESKTP